MPVFPRRYGLTEVWIILLRIQESSALFVNLIKAHSYFLHSLGGCKLKENLLKFSDFWCFVQMTQSSHSYKTGKAKLCQYWDRSMNSNSFKWSTGASTTTSPIIDYCSSAFLTLRWKKAENNWFSMQHVLLISFNFIIISNTNFSSKWFINAD